MDEAQTPPDAPIPKRPLRGMRWVLLGLGLSVILPLAALHVPTVSTGLARWAAASFNPYAPEATVQIGRVSGSPLWKLRVTDVHLATDAETWVSLDTLEVGYALMGLFRKEIHLKRIHLAGLHVRASEDSVGTLNLLRPFPTDTTAQPSEPFAWTVRLDSLILERISGQIAFFHPVRDSVYRVDDLSLRMAGFALAPGENPNISHVDLAASYLLPDQQESGEVHADLQLTSGTLRIDSLSVQSPLSRVVAAGLVMLPGSGVEGDSLWLDVHALPFSFAEVAPWVKGLDPSRSVTLEAELRGTLDDVRATLSADLSDGAMARAQVRYAAAPFVLDADLTLSRIDPAFFLPAGSDVSGRISAQLNAALAGDSLQVISGPAELRVREFALGAIRIDPSQLLTSWTNGAASMRLRTSLPGLTVSGSGSIAPFLDVPEYRLTLQPRDVRIEAFAPDLGVTTDLQGVIRLAGRGFDPETMRVGLDVASVTGELNSLPFTVSLSGILDGSRWNGGLEALLDEASLTTRFSASWKDNLRATISRLRLEGLNLAAVLPGQETTHVNLSLTADVSGTDPTKMAATAQVIVLPSRYGAYAIEGLELDLSSRNGALRVGVHSELAGGAISALVTARPFLRTPRVSLDYITFTNLNARQLGGEALPETHLSGRLEGLVEGFDPAELLAQLVLDLREGSINDQRVDAGTLRISVQESEVKGQLSLSLPEGNSMVRFAARPFDSVPTFAVSEAQIRGLNVGALADVPDFETHLNLDLSLLGSGRSVETLTAEAQVGVLASRINQGALQEGAFTLAWEPEGGTMRGRIEATTGTLELEGQAQRVLQPDSLAYALDVGISGLDWAPFLAEPPTRGTLDARLTVQGTGLDLATLTSEGVLSLQEASWADVRVLPSNVPFRLRDGILHIDEMRLASNVLSAQGGGSLSLFDSLRTVSQFRLQGEVSSVSPLRSLMPDTEFALETGRFSLSAGGEPGLMRIETRVNTQAMQVTNVRATGLELTGVVELGPDLALRAAEVTSRVDFLSHPQINVRTVEATAQYWNNEITLDTRLFVDERRSLEARGTLAMLEEESILTLQSMRVQLDQDRWRLPQPAEIALGDEIVIRQFVLEAPGQQIVADGVINPRGEQFLALTLEDVRIGSVMELIGYQGFAGTLNGLVDLTGPAEAPQLRGDMRLAVVSFGQPTGDVRIGLDYSDLQLRPDITFTHTDGSTLNLAGFIPLDLRLSVQPQESVPEQDVQGTRRTQARAQRERFALTAEETVDDNPLRLSLRADAFDIGWIKPFLDPALIARLDGKLTAAIEVGGTLASPTLGGTAQLRRGRVDIPLLGRFYDGMEADLGFAQDAISLQSFTARSGGTVTGQGTIALNQLAPGAIDIGLRFTNFLAIDSDEFRFRMDGPLQIGGTVDSLDVTGNLRVRSGDIRLTSRATFEDVPLTPEEVLTLESRFGVRVAQRDTVVSELYNAMRLGVSVQLERDTWIRSRSTPEMDIQFMGELEVTKAPGQDLALFGDIEVLPERSRVIQFGRRFDITRGQILFNGPLEEMLIRLSANFTPRNRAREEIATITLGIDGRPLVENDFSLELSSDPQLELADIISYIATGRPASQSLQFGGSETSLTDQAAGLALGQLAGFVQGAAQRQLGLDVIEIEQNGFNSTRLTAGKYISNRFFAAVSQPITFNQSAQNAATEGTTVITVEYEFQNWLFGRFVREGSVLRGTLNWQFAY